MPPPACVPEIVNGRRFVVEVIDDATAAMYRAMTPAQRVLIASAMHREVVEFLRRFLRNEHPSWNTEDVNWEVMRMFEVAADDCTPPNIVTGN